ncbi:MAG: hypothetical protein J2P27_01120 [Actinobacteria bacterium]|nr:hypothetical protein [Actinomycetota bacterium]
MFLFIPHFRTPGLVLGVLAAGLVLTDCGPAPKPVASDSVSNAAMQTCGLSEVTAHADGFRGVAIYVNSPGPDDLVVDVIDGFGTVRRLFQQVTKRENGATFDFPAIGFGPVSVVVSSKNLGVCGITAVETG